MISKTIELPVIPLVLSLWFGGYLFYEVGRCSTIMDIYKSLNKGAKFPRDLKIFILGADEASKDSHKKQ